ncbi:MAG TPA: GAF domain-containing protein [Vitreimonas sp.]|nr:GAF domain-containing protein [Vitreimonas sp.]
MPVLTPRPIDATLSVTKAARHLGVHPNTVRAWSDAGRLRYYRINPRGDRRYRLSDLQRFLASAAAGAPEGAVPTSFSSRRLQRASLRSMPPPADAGPGEQLHGSEARGAEARVLGELAALAQGALEPGGMSLDALLGAAAHAVRDGLGMALTAIWQLNGSTLVPRGAAGSGSARLIARSRQEGVMGAALAADGAGEGAVLRIAPDHPVVAGLGPELAVPIRGAHGNWGVLLLAGLPAVHAHEVAVAAGRSISALVALNEAVGRMTRQVHRADALLRVAGDLGSRLDVDGVLSGVVDHALILFEADRAAIVLSGPDSRSGPAASRGLSSNWLSTASGVRPGSLAADAVGERRPLHVVGYRSDPRAAPLRAAIVQEGFDTICVAPLFAGDEVLGLLTLHHDRPRPWADDELASLAAFASQASIAVRTARTYHQTATWAAQLQSIQALGARLNRMTDVAEIGTAIATELRQLIDYHNVRVYRLDGEDLIPVAMLGQVGEYVDETPEQLKVRVGEGITGWVAEKKVPANLPDAASDSRANTIPGTEADLDESMLLAPMVFEDRVLGVLVLSKLGLGQFIDDDLRLLVIYASFAAQAMANADATQQLRVQTEAVERQVRSQHELLKITESILTTLDPRKVLDQIADRLERLVGYDNISIEVYDPVDRKLRPITARGVYADEFLQEWAVDEEGVATWVIEHSEPVLIVDQFDDPRVRHFSSGPVHGGLIVVPLRGREGVTGVLTVERLGAGNTFSVHEFELVKLFAAQVSIALQNAEIHRAVEIRARTDGLTGLLNHATFRERLGMAVAQNERFSLVMMDLDDFKGVNDAFGHQAGDRLLTEIGAAVVGAGREMDQVFRYGGDEFIVLLPGAPPDAAVAVAERIRAAVTAVGGTGTRWHADGRHVSASFGVATFPDDGMDAETVLLAADRACFVAKRSGAGRIASADEGLTLAAEFSLQEPTPVDSSSVPAA